MGSNEITNGVLAGLQKAAALLVQRLNQRLAHGYPSGDPDRDTVPIQDTIVIQSPQIVGGRASIEITLGGPRAPYAAAYEYGSGVHGKRGQTYQITAKEVPLAFPFTLTFMPGVKFIGMVGKSNRRLRADFAEDGQVSGITLWKYVDHPGVEPKPYIVPSMLETKDEIRKILGQEFMAALRLGKERVEVIRVPK